MTKRTRAIIVGVSLALTAVAGGSSLAQKRSNAISAAVADPGRPQADSSRDATRHPSEVAAFAGVRPGQTVVEFVPGGGYFTRILAKVVGPKGHVYAVIMAANADRASKSASAVAAENANVTIITQTGSAVSLPEKADLAWISDNYHDLRNPGYGAQDMATFDKAVFDCLKPGGIFLIEDYHTALGVGAAQTNTLHRIEESLVKAEVVAAGFVFDGESPLLNNPKDDHTLKVFDPAIRGEADQYLLRFRKPG